MKKIYSLLVAAILSATTMFASDIQVSGIWYNFDIGNSSASVTYQGNDASAYADEYTGDVLIPAKVVYNDVVYAVAGIDDYAFKACKNLNSVLISQTVNRIGSGAFAECSGLDSVICYAVTPPALGSNAFDGCTNLLYIYVPVESLNVYKSADNWSQYENLLAAIPVAPDYSGEGTADSPYLIADEAHWNTLATRVSEGVNYSGVYFRLTANIAVTRMIGSDSNHAFTGSFDGDGHTITATLSSSDPYCAPFAYTYGATISNLHTTGTITTSSTNAGGVVGRNGTANLTLVNVSSDMTINSSFSGSASHGGLVGYTINATLTGCLFAGQLLGESTGRCAGMVGWKTNTDGSSVSLKDCVVAPKQVTMSATNSKTFVVISGGGVALLTNCYYTQAIGAAQGQQARSITAETDISVSVAGEATVYNVSGITSYGTGIKYDGVLYAGNGDELSLNLSGAKYGYAASTGTLSGTENPYTLVMADADCRIKKLAPQPTGEFEIIETHTEKSVYNGTHFSVDPAAGREGDQDGFWVHYNEPAIISALGNETITAVQLTLNDAGLINIVIASKGDVSHEGNVVTVMDVNDTSLSINLSYLGAVQIKQVKVYYTENEPTDISSQLTDDNGKKANKVIRNGQVVIEHNGKTYNILGAQVK